jgi:HD-like signal output (HDOD) protein
MTTMTSASATDMARLVRELEQLPPQHNIALRVLHLANDPDAGAADLAGAISLDPALTAQLLRTANSAYYGLSGRVPNVTFAVTVLGFTTVRGLAAAIAAGLTGEGAASPAGFWHRACSFAAATTRTGAQRQDGFCAGLLCDLGDALLHRAAPDVYAGLDETGAVGTADRMAQERLLFGITHEDAASRVLRAWRFPDDLIAAIASHHAPAETLTAPLGRALRAAVALVEISQGISDAADPAVRAALALGKVGDDDLGGLIAQVNQQTEELESSLT